MHHQQELTLIIDQLQSKKKLWANLEVAQKIKYLLSARSQLIQESNNWVECCALAKGLDFNSALIGQEWLSGPFVVLNHLNQIIDYLNTQKNIHPKKIKCHENQNIVQVLPSNIYDSLMWRNFTAEVWIEKNKPATQLKLNQNINNLGEVCLILGAGNVSSIAPLDALYKLIQDGAVCLVKLNPVNDYLLPIFNKVFAHLIQDGFLNFVKTDMQTSQWLCEQSNIHSIHLTGSHHTHDAVVWGSANDPQTEVRKKQNNPKCNKKITSELGCVTPVIIVPGRWTKSELEFQAQHVVSMVENNASFNCNAAKVLILNKQWSQRQEFLDCLSLEFSKCPLRKSYYPGAQNRYDNFKNNYPNAEIFGNPKTECLQWMFISNLEENNDNEMAFQSEAFCGILAEVSIDAQNGAEFLNKVTDFCNEKLWGTLSATILIHPSTEKELKNEFENTLSHLKYGSIGVNCWSALSYVLGVTVWGAFPGHSLSDIQSGIGFVHNNLMFNYPEKSVIRAPFKIWPKPLWFYNNENLKEIAQKLFNFEANKSPFNFIKLLMSNKLF